MFPALCFRCIEDYFAASFESFLNDLRAFSIASEFFLARAPAALLISLKFIVSKLLSQI